MDKLKFSVEQCTINSQQDWLKLRLCLWPDCLAEKHTQDIAKHLAIPGSYAAFIAYDSSKVAVGFIEVAIRKDYVNGTKTSPVAFIEGIYVIPSKRLEGIAVMLIKRCENFAKEKSCTELSSDCLLDNINSYKTHIALGFKETERVIFFSKEIS